MFKKVFSLVLVVTMALSLVACGGGSNSGSASSDGGSQAVSKSNKNMKFNDEDFKDFFYYYIEDEVLHITSEQIDGKTKMISCKQLEENRGLKHDESYMRDYDLVKDNYKSIRFDNYVLLIDPAYMFSGEYANIENIEKLVVKGRAVYLFHNFRGTADFSKMNTSYITFMAGMFSDSKELKSLNISNWDVSNVRSMSGMFERCSSLTSLDLNNWDVSNVEGMDSMFMNCDNLSEIKINKWNVQNVKNVKRVNYGGLWVDHYGMSSMFERCFNLKSLDLSNWKLNDECMIDHMFRECYFLENLKIGNWEKNVSNGTRAFEGCKRSIVPEWYKAKDAELDYGLGLID